MVRLFAWAAMRLKARACSKYSASNFIVVPQPPSTWVRRVSCWRHRGATTI
jgi:hypothetical protein